MGIYITSDDIIDKAGLSDDDVEEIIDTYEEALHEWFGEIFYELEDQVFKFRGNDKPTIFVPTLAPYNLVSIDSVVYINYTGDEDTLDSSNYEFNEYSITRLDGLWYRSRKENYKITCSLGNASTDRNGNTNKRYKPKILIQALKVLVGRDINELYGTSDEGTGMIDDDKILPFNFNKEKAHDYSYERRKVDSKSLGDSPTGIPSIDFKLNQLKKDKIVMMGLDSNLNDEDSYSDRWLRNW